MSGWRQAVELAMTNEEIAQLTSVSHSRSERATVCKILGQEEIKPHKVRYYLERRDAEFEQKMAEVLRLSPGPSPEKGRPSRINGTTR
jgi:hypothetical protein